MFNDPLIMPVAILVLISLPLVVGMVPPNRIYGFRTAKTLSDSTIWYSANRFGGFAMIMAAAAYMVIASRVSLGGNNEHVGTLALLVFLAIGVTLVFVRRLGKKV